MMPTLFNKTLLAGLGSLLMALSASAIATETEYGKVVPVGAKAGELSMFPCDIYMKGDDRNYAGDCGTLVVPENNQNEKSRLIALPVTRIKATGDSPLEPIFYFQGGPGGANKHNNPTSGLLEKHDFVMVGYRGREGQVTPKCPEIAQALSTIEVKYLADESLAEVGRGAAACASRLQAEGIDIDGYSMNQTVDDMEAARIALGYERINLLGQSYGTRLEIIYQARHPQSLNRVVMLAVNPSGHFVFDRATIDEQLKLYSKLCQQDSHCSARTSNLYASMKEVSQNMPTSWMGISINRDLILLGSFMSLHESIKVPGQPPLNGPAIIDMWLDAAEGDASGMAFMSTVLTFMVPDILDWFHFLTMGTSASDLISATRDYKAEFSQQGTLLGSPMSHFLLGPIIGWPATPDQSIDKVAVSNIETLLIGGTLDFSTPPQFARDELLPYLTRGQQVVIEHIGHTGSFWNSQAEARSQLLNTFFETGVVDDSLYKVQAPVFNVETSWSGIAKMMLAGFIFVICLLIVIGVFVWRKFNKKRITQTSTSTQAEFS